MGAWERLLFFALLYVAAAIAGFIWLEGADAARAPALSNTVIGALGVGFVALIGFGLWSTHAADQEADMLRADAAAERRKAVALRAEIDLAIKTLARSYDPERLAARRERAVAAVRDAESRARVSPMTLGPPEFVVFDRSDDPLNPLPDYAISRTVQFHQTVSGLRHMSDAFEVGRYDNAPRAAQLEALEQFYDQGVAALYRALKAKAALTAVLRGVEVWPEDAWARRFLNDAEQSLAARILARDRATEAARPTQALIAEASSVGGLIEDAERAPADRSD